MRPIKTIAIVGAGAMGAAYAKMFADAHGFEVSFVARGERHRRLADGSLKINGRSYRFPAIHPDRAKEPADLVIVALNHHHLPDALGDIAAVVGRDTVILSVMNGLGFFFGFHTT